MAFDDTKNEHSPKYLVDKYGLAERPGDLILQALDDLSTIGQTPGYAIKFFKWHEYEEKNKTCAVCLAGAVAANRLGVPFDTNWSPGEEIRIRGFFVRSKMDALDRFRVGDLSGLAAMGYDLDHVRYDDRISEAFSRVYRAFYEMERQQEQTARDNGMEWFARISTTDMNTSGFRRWKHEMCWMAAVLNANPLPASGDEDYTPMSLRAKRVLENWNAVGVMEFAGA